MMNSFELPELRSESALPLNPRETHVDERLFRWARRHHLVDHDGDLRRLIAMRMARLAAYTLPEASLAELTLYAQWGAWICMVDDMLDLTPLGRDPESVKALMDGFVGILKGQKAGRRSPTASALEDLWSRTVVSTPQDWRERFISHYADFAAASHEEAMHQSHARRTSSAEHIALRRRTITLLPMMEIAERAAHILLPTEWYEFAPLHVLRTALIDAVGWTNDLASARSDDPREELHNIVTITERENGCTRSEARARVTEMINERLRAFVATQEKLLLLQRQDPRSAALARICRYAQLLRVLLCALLQWYEETSRFGDDGLRTPAT